MKHSFMPVYKQVLCLLIITLLLNGCAGLSTRQNTDMIHIHNKLFSALSKVGIGTDLTSALYFITVHNQSASWDLINASYAIPTSYNLETLIHKFISQIESQQFKVQSEQLQKAPPVNQIRIEIYYSNLLVGILSFRQEIAGYMAIVIDDVGHNTRALPFALKIHRPLTFAILPHLAKSKQLAKIFNEHNQHIILHQPMQPIKNLNPGPGAIYSTTPPNEIRKVLTENLASVPYAQGLNNHMGSLITSKPDKMKTILLYLKSKNLLFLDSITGKSVCSNVAKNIQFPIYKRNVFIDNKHDKSYINHQLDQLITMTLRHKQAIGIGHFYPITLECIRDKIPELDKKQIKLVYLSDLQPGY